MLVRHSRERCAKRYALRVCSTFVIIYCCRHHAYFNHYSTPARRHTITPPRCLRLRYVNIDCAFCRAAHPHPRITYPPSSPTPPPVRPPAHIAIRFFFTVCRRLPTAFATTRPVATVVIFCCPLMLFVFAHMPPWLVTATGPHCQLCCFVDAARCCAALRPRHAPDVVCLPAQMRVRAMYARC